MNYILFSGGYDSTYLLLQKIKDASEEKPLTLITINTSGLGQKQYKMEEKARKKILKKLKKTNPHILELQIDVKGKFNVEDAPYGYNQQAWWVLYCLPYIDNNSTVYFGYCYNDHSLRHKQDYQTILDGYSAISKKEIKFRYPIQYDRKCDIIDFLKKQDYYDLCWTCDCPEKKGKTYVTCGECEKCIERKVAEYELKLRKKVQKNLLGD